MRVESGEFHKNEVLKYIVDTDFSVILVITIFYPSLIFFFVVSNTHTVFCTSMIMFFFLQSLLMDPLLNHFEHKDCFREASVGFRLENAGFVSSLTYLNSLSFLIALSSSFKPPVV